ncbi:rho GTPase-activating protein 28 [Danio rerio]|uniref:Rho GTPase-activating protein 28 n=1 Tax=Danio rerio TaxID=7955 RepID=Q5U3S8_DANRE|nr:rho GTPase-activating protein 28 [Danio rerio]AAH85408.1 Zgc:101668 [Danio rerio]|eukprot:NP_001007436.1 rho GTPase-activating protein 28 [Danio rerio]
MDVQDCGGVILTAFHSFRTHADDEQKHTAADNRKAQHQPIVSMSVCGPGAPASPEQCVSRDSMEDYWSEVKNIQEDTHTHQQEPAEQASTDEAELEEAWLQDAGLTTLITGAQGDGPTEALLSTLTHSQAAMVKKRLDNYTHTLRKKNRQPTRHVRDVFSTPEPASELTSPVSPNGEISPKPPQSNPPKAPPACPDFTSADSKGSSSTLRTIILSFSTPYSEGTRGQQKLREMQECRKIRKEDRELLCFQVVKPRQGTTRVMDLSSDDMRKIGYISLIELTTFYGNLGIELRRNRVMPVKARDTGIFGVPLLTLLQNDRKIYPGSRIPLFFKKLLAKLEQTGLQTEGILRVPGSAVRVKQLRQELDLHFYDDRFDWDQVHQNDAAALLKMFIRELPYPLLTKLNMPAFTALQRISSPKYQIQALHLLIMILPEPNRDTLKALLEFLRKVVACEEKNRMNVWNVSMIVAPNLFTYIGKNAKQEEVKSALAAAQIVCTLISHQDLLWTVPCFLINQVRKMNDAAMAKKSLSSERSKRGLLSRWKDRERSEVKDLRDGVIRVHAPLHAKVSMAIQLSTDMKARDITAHFDTEKGHGSRSGGRRQKQLLFEVGGNIGERCLDPDAYLLDVYHANPYCQWVLK